MGGCTQVDDSQLRSSVQEPLKWYNHFQILAGKWHGGVNIMGMQIREFAAWARNRKVMATLLVTMTLAIGMLIGTVISGHVGASHPAVGQRRHAIWRFRILCSCRAPLLPS